jgi:hypothetical protein
MLLSLEFKKKVLCSLQRFYKKLAEGWNVDEMYLWRGLAEKEQQVCFDRLGTPMWREFEPTYYGHLKRQIEFALFGVPEEEPSEILNDGTGFIHSVFCLTTGSKPPPKRFLHIVRSRASSFK